MTNPAAGITATSRAGRARLSFHLYNTAEDVEMAIAAQRATVTPTNLDGANIAYGSR